MPTTAARAHQSEIAMSKIILSPQIKSAQPMTPMDLNRQRFTINHTVITPGMLDEAAKTVAKSQALP